MINQKTLDYFKDTAEEVFLRRERNKLEEFKNPKADVNELHRELLVMVDSRHGLDETFNEIQKQTKGGL